MTNAVLPANPNGANYLGRGFKLILEPGLRLFVVLPLAINILIFGTLMTLSLSGFGSAMERLLAWLPDWLDFISWILWPLAVVLLLAIAMYLFSIVANLIAAPFNGLLAEKVEERISGKEVNARETVAQAIASFPRSIFREIQKLLYYASWAIVALIISLIFSPLSGLIWFLLGAWMMALEYTDYAMDNNKLSFAEAKKRLGKKRGTNAGFGCLVMIGTMIPIVNLVIMPAAVAGGTLLWHEQLKHQ